MADPTRNELLAAIASLEKIGGVYDLIAARVRWDHRDILARPELRPIGTTIEWNGPSQRMTLSFDQDEVLAAGVTSAVPDPLIEAWKAAALAGGRTWPDYPAEPPVVVRPVTHFWGRDIINVSGSVL
jgi:hypothetical protein